MDTKQILLDGKVYSSIDQYIANGGFEGLKKALEMRPEAIIEEVRKSGLRGRGGAGFPTARKWQSIRDHACPTKYLCCNAAEGEPGTYKDRYLIQRNPYVVVEGIAIAAYAIGVKRAFLCVKGIFTKELEALRRALVEAFEKGYVGANAMKSGFDIDIALAPGPDDYLFGEEKALLEVVEGNLPWPRQVPPYIHGLFVTGNNENPTAVNNVETLANVPHIVSKGADWFRSIGTQDTPGTMIFTLSGDIKKPGVYERPMGTTLQALIDESGGGSSLKIKAVMSGPSNPVILPSRFDTPLDFGSMKKIGSGLGSGGFIVYDESACMLKVTLMFSRFLAIESCGQCNACKAGTATITEMLGRLEHGDLDMGNLEEIKLWLAQVDNGARCYLATAEKVAVASLLSSFADEIVAHEGANCPRPRKIILPKISSYDEAKHEFKYHTSYWEDREKTERKAA